MAPKCWNFSTDRNVRQSATLLLITLILACASLPPTDDEVKGELQTYYNKFAEGFKRNDPGVWLSYLTSDFTLTLFNGSVQSHEWVTQYVTQNANTFTVDTLVMRVRGIERRGNQVVATVEQTSSRRFHDGSGDHRLDVGAIQLETWEKINGRWRLRAVREKDILYLRRDGKSS
jgi:hypothetical protein